MDSKNRFDGDGKARLVFLGGGAFQPAFLTLPEMTNMPIRAFIGRDASEEFSRNRLTHSRSANLFLSSPTHTAQQIIDYLKTLGKPAKALYAALEQHTGSLVHGAGQVGGISYGGLMMESEEFESLLANVISRTMADAGGYLKDVKLEVLVGGGGGMGRGSHRLAVDRFARKIAKMAPGCNLSVRLYVIDGSSWMDAVDLCMETDFPFTTMNMATNINAIVADLIHPIKYEGINFDMSVMFTTLPNAGKEFALRDRYVRQLAALLFADEYQAMRESVSVNKKMTRGALGAVEITIPEYYPSRSVDELAATVAGLYSQQIRDMLETETTRVRPRLIRSIETLPSMTAQPNRLLEIVMEDVGQVKDNANLDMLGELTGAMQYVATAEIFVDTGESRVLAHELTTRTFPTTNAILQFFADAAAMQTKLYTDIKVAERNTRRDAARARSANKKVTAYWNWMFGAIGDKLTALIFALPVAFEFGGKKKQLRLLSKAAEKARIANEQYAKSLAVEEALKALRLMIDQRQRELNMHLTRTASTLSRIASRGTTMRGLVIRAVDDRLPDLMWASGLDTIDELQIMLVSCIESVTIDALARYVFSYNEPAPADATTIARLLKTASPAIKGMAFTSFELDGTGVKPDLKYFLPLNENDMNAVREAYHRIDGTSEFFRLSCVAGLFIGVLKVYKVMKWDKQVMTPTTRRVLDTMAGFPEIWARHNVPEEPMYYIPEALGK